MPRSLPTGISRRGKLLWLTYAITPELAARYGVKKVQRESAKTGDKRTAQALLAQRKREVANGSWGPAKVAGAGLTVRSFFDRWTADRNLVSLRSAKRDEEVLAEVLEDIGDMRLGDVRRVHVLEAMGKARARSAKRGARKGRTRAPGTVLKIYKKLHAMFAAALRAELVFTNPCTLLADGVELPKNLDVDPRWRKSAIYTRAELEQLISDERIPMVRRMRYALLLLTGMRAGEMVARRVGDYDQEARPLGRLMVETQLGDDPDEDEERELKTGVQREAPVHPVLAKMLAEWLLNGYAMTFGRQPEPGDLLLPNTNGDPLTSAAVYQMLQRDLKMLGFRKRRTHDARRTFISLARADGASDLLRWVTHGPSGSVFDDYTTPPWEALCAQVSCLRVSLRGGRVRHIGQPVSAQRGAHSRETTPLSSRK